MFRGIIRPLRSNLRFAFSSRRQFGEAPFVLSRRFSDNSQRIDPDVQEKIMEISRRFLDRVKDAQVDKLTPTASFEELGMDSLDSVDFIVALEESFGFDVSNEDAENRIRGINDACVVFTEYVDRKAKEAQEEPPKPSDN